MKLELLMHNITRKNVIQGYQLGILKPCVDLLDKKINFNGGGKKRDRNVEQLKRSRSHENDGETPPSKRKCTGLVGKHIEIEFTG